MQKQVKISYIHLAKINDQMQAVEIEPYKMLGKISLKQAQKYVYRMDPSLTVTDVETISQTYEMNVKDFIQHGKVKQTIDQ